MIEMRKNQRGSRQRTSLDKKTYAVETPEKYSHLVTFKTIHPYNPTCVNTLENITRWEYFSGVLTV